MHVVNGGTIHSSQTEIKSMTKQLKILTTIAALISLSSASPAKAFDLLPRLCVDLVLKKPVPCQTVEAPGPLGIGGAVMAWRASRQIRKRIQDVNDGSEND